jgi:putative peptidoglycan lipid II flippase
VVRSAMRLAAAGVVMALVLWLADTPVRSLTAGRALQNELALALYVLIGAVVYGGMVIALFGRRWFTGFMARRSSPAAQTPPPPDTGN